MPLWTVQPVTVWEQIRDHGRAVVDPVRVDPDGWVHPQYAWLMGQLRTRLAGYQGRLPWWAYCARPDLRGVRHRRPHGSRQALIEFEPPPGVAVEFPSWAWNLVFSWNYLPRDRADDREWWARLKRAGVGPDDDPPEPFRSEMEASWERLFSPDLPARPVCRQYGFRFGAEREAVVEVLEADWVRGVREFRGTNRAMARAGNRD